jgi:hypothetical protein
MNASVDLAPDIPPEAHVVRDTVAIRLARPSTRDEREVSSGWLVVATIWSALLAYACVQALLAG